MQKFDDLWNESDPPKYKSYGINNFREIPQMRNISFEKQREMEVVANVLPFKVNNYVVENLIDWDDAVNDPIFVLTFPQKEMLRPQHFKEMVKAMENGDKKTIQTTANKIRLQLNPHPAGQMEHNVPQLKDGTKLYGMQHKYKETVLFFPSQGQTCHAYCTFCFRWPQFVGMNELKFAMRESELLVQYIKENPSVTDVLFTGGDPMIMKTKLFSEYVNSLLDADLPNLKTIRIGTKALGYWPYRFLSDDDSDEMLRLFEKITKRGIHLAFMAHFNHPRELSTKSVEMAIRLIRKTGAQIRTQSPILAHINDNAKTWADMWKKQVNLGCVPYYMFVARDTGAQHFFGVPLVKAQEIFRDAYQQVSGLCRTVRGPSMSATPGKIQVLGVIDIGKKKAIAMRFLQGRDPTWVQKPFLAKYDENAIWIDELKPFTGNKFFFEEGFGKISSQKKSENKGHLINNIIHKFGKKSGKISKTNKLLRDETTSIIALKRKKEFEDRQGLNTQQIGKKNFP
ncbi:lysine 2,3-aminomutase [Candidatus Nitrosotenuis chungbukensis]|uniref:KamA family radical SAM protein n=1 Tax=Candidatus Nitrosotenuis chungbukensis TaxID=1353246 RepID=UPI000B136933|nr:lysine 2,3-aminomutase [Candidatus Nitrosotenuis chungbukensis]WKT57392.1 lysine 2,3-aminomutase [Candidatus Nitrosotenuis chungbukensis]